MHTYIPIHPPLSVIIVVVVVVVRDSCLIQARGSGRSTSWTRTRRPRVGEWALGFASSPCLRLSTHRGSPPVRFAPESTEDPLSLTQRPEHVHTRTHIHQAPSPPLSQSFSLSLTHRPTYMHTSIIRRHRLFCHKASHYHTYTHTRTRTHTHTPIRLSHTPEHVHTRPHTRTHPSSGAIASFVTESPTRYMAWEHQALRELLGEVSEGGRASQGGSNASSYPFL